jgi:hypothetical protein
LAAEDLSDPLPPWLAPAEGFMWRVESCFKTPGGEDRVMVKIVADMLHPSKLVGLFSKLPR